MAKNKAPMTVVTGKTLGNLIDLQMATQESLNKINAAMQDAQDKKEGVNQQLLIDLTKKLVDINQDNYKLQKKIADNTGKNFEELSKGMKNWKTWGDKLKDLKAGLSDRMSPESISKRLLSKLNIGGILNQKLMALDFKKQAKALGTAPADKKELDKQANQFAAAQMAMMREQAKIDRIKKHTGATDDQIKNSPTGAAILNARDTHAQTAQNLLPGGKSLKDTANKMGGNTAAQSEPLVDASANPLTVPTGAGKEAQEEQQKVIDQQIDLLQQIADNTSALTMGKSNPKDDKKSDTSQKGLLGGLLDSVMGLFGDSFLSAIRSVFSIRSILRVITKFFAPAMLIGSLVNGIMDGFNAWMETGSIKEALIAGLGGVISFLSFGLFDKDTVRGIVDAVSGFVDQYITQPVSNFINGLGDAFDTYIAQPIQQAFDSMMQWASDLSDLLNDYVITPIQQAIQPVKDFFSDMVDSVLNFLKNIEIPGISFKVPVYGDVSFGPWHPFDASDKKSADNVAAAAPTTGQTIMNASKNNADDQAAVDAQKNQPAASVVNANVSSNSSTTQVIKPAVRNQESSQSRYLAARY